MAEAVQIQPLTDITPARSPVPLRVVDAQASQQSDPFALRPLSDITTKPLPSIIDPQQTVDALSTKVNADKAQISATIDATTKNSAIALGLENTNEELDKDTLDAFDKQTTISKYPPGIANLLGIFDTDWNGRYQTQRIQTNALKATQARTRAESLININNQQPALEGFKAKLAAEDYDNATKLLDLGVKFRGLDQKDAELQIAIAEYGLKAGDERRKNLEFAVNQMTEAQVNGELKRAKAGQGDFANYPGFLERRLQDEAKARLDLHQLNTAVNQGDADAADKAALRLSQRFPNSLLQGAVQKAIDAGSPTVDFGQGIPKIPVHIAIAALKNNADNEQFAREYNIQQSNQQFALNLDKVQRSISSLALLDPEARNLSATLAQGVANVDRKDYNSVQNANALTLNIGKKAEEIAKRAASALKTPEAKAALVQFGTTGEITPEGATALVTNYAGSPGVAAASFHTDAYKLLNTAIASRVSKAGINGIPAFDGSETGTAAILAALQRQATTKLDEIKGEVLADPIVGKQISDAMSQNIAVDQMKRVFATKVKDPNSSAVWQELLSKPGFRAADGTWDMGAVMLRLEQESILSGGKADYNQAFIDDMKNASIKGDQGTAASKSVADRAIEMHYMGSDAYRAAMSDFLNRTLIPTAEAAHTQVKQKLDVDRSGKTQNDAAFYATQGLAGDAGVPNPFAPDPRNAKGINDELIKARQNAPSATGANTTAERMRALYK